MVSLVGWVATSHGLPCVHVSGGPVDVMVGDRLLAHVEGEALLADPLAPMGVAETISAADQNVTLTRTSGPESHGIVTLSTGRGVQSAWWIGVDDPTDWDSGVTRFATGAARWSALPQLESGTAVLVVDDPAQEQPLVNVLRAREPIILATPRPEPGVPSVRLVTVTSVGRTRVSPKGWISLEVKWAECRVPQSGFSAPVVSWGEVVGSGRGWRAWSVLEWASVLTGGPEPGVKEPL